MSKPEWGEKRSCQGCGANFYDLLRSPIVCSKCGAVFIIPEAPIRRPLSREAKYAAARRGAGRPVERAFDPVAGSDASEPVDDEKDKDDNDDSEENEDDESEDTGINTIDGGDDDDDEEGPNRDSSDEGRPGS
jgi:uncharacterized protein (TIGR02300 family)